MQKDTFILWLIKYLKQILKPVCLITGYLDKT